MIAKGFLCLLLAGLALAQDYADDDQAARGQHLAPNYARGYHQDQYQTQPAEPYDFGFQSTDEFGTIMNRQESSDSSGAVRGSYGYTDPHGVFRHVDYVADEHGFRAEVKSNEPGMGTQSPANVQIYAEPPPAGVIVERPYYHPHPGHPHSGQSGQRNPAASGSSAQGRQVRPAAGGRTPATSNQRRAVRPAPYPFNVQAAPQQGSHQQGAQQQGAYQQGAYQQGGYQQGAYQRSTSQYPSTVSSQYASNNAQYGSTSGQYDSTSGQYDSTSGQYGASSGQYGASSGQYGSQESANAYPARSQYPSYSSQSQSGASQHQASTGSSQATASQAPIVAKPYDGPRYRIGNPHVTDLVRADKEESGSILLPTLVATGAGPTTTLVKHIHTYPAAPSA